MVRMLSCDGGGGSLFAVLTNTHKRDPCMDTGVMSGSGGGVSLVLCCCFTLACFAFAAPLIPSYTFSLSLSLFLYYTILVRQLPIDARGVGRCRSGLASFRSSTIPVVLQDAPVLRL